MGRPPGKCPMCKERVKWKCVDTTNLEPDAAAKAMSLAIYNNPYAVAHGKTIKTYYCGKCRYKQDYKY